MVICQPFVSSANQLFSTLNSLNKDSEFSPLVFYEVLFKKKITTPIVCFHTITWRRGKRTRTHERRRDWSATDLTMRRAVVTLTAWPRLLPQQTEGLSLGWFLCPTWTHGCSEGCRSVRLQSLTQISWRRRQQRRHEVCTVWQREGKET